MRVILSFIFALLTLEGGHCACDTPIFRYLTAPNGIIQTDNFPHEFKTPLCIHWLIDSLQPYTIFNESGNHFSNGKRIRVFLTQLYLKENLTFIDYIKYPYPNGHLLDENEKNSVRKQAVETGYSRERIPRFGSDETNSSTIVSAYATELRFLGIQLELHTPYGKHIRATNFFHTYGFNMSYSIVDEKIHLQDFNRKEICSLSNCSYAGDCYVSRDYRRFSCSCHAGRHGEYCEYNSETCDPRNNITFCRNGGTCKMQAPGVGVCFCPAGYGGPLCGLKLESAVKECPGPECDEVCVSGSGSVHRPCSCHKGRNIPKGTGWMRFEVMLQSLDFLPERDFRSEREAIPAADWKLKEEIEKSIRQRLDTVPGLNGTDTSVAVVSFGIASKIKFQYFAPNDTVGNERLVKEALTSGPLLPTLELSHTFKINSYPALTLTKLFGGGSSVPIKVGKNFDLHCEAQGSATVKFRWFKEGLPIDRSLATREINEQSYGLPKYVSKSILMFTSSTLEDRGVFTCQVSDMGEEQCLDITVSVVAPPYILVDPMSLTLDEYWKLQLVEAGGDSVTLSFGQFVLSDLERILPTAKEAIFFGEEDQVITCVSENETPKHNFSYVWEKDGVVIQNQGHWTNEIIEDLYPYGSLLRIIKAYQSATYTCKVNNLAGSNQTSIDVRVLKRRHLTFCDKNLDDYGIQWNKTALGQVAKRWCPTGFLGFAQRACQKSSSLNPVPKWGLSDFSRCFAKELRDLTKYLQILRMGFANKTQIFELTQRLINHLSRKSFLYRGEGETVIEVLEDIASYAIDKKDVIDKTNDNFIRSFLNATAQLLRFPASCSLPSCIISLGQLLHKISTKFPTESNPLIWESNVFILEKLQIATTPFSHPYRLPFSRIHWASDFLLQIPTSVNGSKVNQGAIIVFIVFRNISSIVFPEIQTTFTPRNSFRVVSPIISIGSHSNPKYTHSAPLHITFNISNMLSDDVFLRSRNNFSCGGMESLRNEHSILWTPNACTLNQILENGTVECVCEHFGQFALLHFGTGLSSAPLTNLEIHWSVILGTVVLIAGCGLTMICILVHIEFQFSSDSLYSIKLIVCSTLIFSHLFILSLKSEVNSIGLSTTFSSLMILCLASLLMKPLLILVSDQIDLYAWLRSMSTLTLVFGFFLVCSLPIWTAAIALSHWRSKVISALGHHLHDLRDGHNSVLSTDSSLFGIFAVMVSVILFAFLYFTTKAFFKLRRLRIQVTSPKNQFIEYRIRIVGRSLIVTTVTVLTMVTGILHINIDSHLYQYLFSLATSATGLAVFLSYTVKSEHPIPHRVVQYFTLEPHPDTNDPEKFLTIRPFDGGRATQSRTPEKTFENGHVSSILLPQNQCMEESHRERTTTFDSINSGQLSEAETTLETIGGSSLLSTSSGRRDSLAMRSCSVSDKRPSLASNGTTSISRSLTNPSQTTSCRPLLHQNHGCSGNCRRARKERSFSCGGGSCGPIKPDRGRCFIREVEAADYVLPSKGPNVDAVSLQAQKSLPLPTDLCPTNGYVDVNNRGPALNLRELSTFEPQLLKQHSNKPEALYESIKYESIKDVGSMNGHPHQRHTLTFGTPFASNTLKGGYVFKKTDPLPPTPPEFVGSNKLHKQYFPTKSDPDVNASLKTLNLEEKERRGVNGFHTLPFGAQSLR